MTKEEKLKAIREHMEKRRAESPDGKTSWDRVEEFRLKHGRLPNKDDEPPTTRASKEEL